MAKDTPKKASVKKENSKEKEEVVEEEVKVTEKVTKERDEDEGTPLRPSDSEGQAQETKETIVSEKEENSEEKEDGEGEEKKEEPEIQEAEKEENTDGNEEREDATPRATVYADDFSAATVEKHFSMNRMLLFILIVIISAGIFFSGMLLYQSSNSNFVFPQIPFLSQPTPTPTETPTPTPTPAPEVTLSDYDVQVLNGSGVSGAAGSVASLLEEEGFEDIDVGNADDQDLTDTEVQMKEDIPEEVFATIEKVLTEYSVEEGEALDEDSDYDIIVTVGQQNEEEDTEEEEDQ